MSPDPDETIGTADSLLLGRRSLLKKAAIGGGLALSAPIVMTSFSPAAACSVPDPTTVEVGLPNADVWIAGTDLTSLTTTTSPSFSADANQLLLVAFAVRYPGTTAETAPVVTGTGVTGNFQLVAQNRFVGTATTANRTILYVYQANVTTGGSQTVTVTFSEPVNRFTGSISSADQNRRRPVSARMRVHPSRRTLRSPLPPRTSGPSSTTR